DIAANSSKQPLPGPMPIRRLPTAAGRTIIAPATVIQCRLHSGALPMFANLSRRRFLALSAAAATGAAWFDVPGVLSAAGLADAKDAWGGFPVGVQSYSLRKFKLPEAIRHLQGMGVRYVELAGTHLPPTASDAEIAETLKLVHDAGIKVSAHGVNKFTKDHEANRKVV